MDKQSFIKTILEYYNKNRNKEFIIVRRRNGKFTMLVRSQGFTQLRGSHPGEQVVKIYNDREAARAHMSKLTGGDQKKPPEPPDEKTRQIRLRLQKRINRINDEYAPSLNEDCPDIKVYNNGKNIEVKYKGKSWGGFKNFETAETFANFITLKKLKEKDKKENG